MVSVVRRTNEVIPRRARLLQRWVTVSDEYTISACNSARNMVNSALHPCRVVKSSTSFARVKVGMLPLPGGR